MTQDNTGQTQMTNPPGEKPKDPEAPKKAVKMVKVKVMHPIRVPDPQFPGQDTTAKLGSVIELPEETVKELEKPIEGTYAFSGERHQVDGDVARHQIKRVERVS